MSDSDEELLDELLLKWEELHDEGQVLPAEELCPSDRPDLLLELQNRIEALLEMNERFDRPADPSAPADSVPADNAAPPMSGVLNTVHRYSVLMKHAQGGLGEIYKAHDSNIGREVALKSIRRELHWVPERRKRFIQEAEVTGQLEHPGVVPVYALGHSEDGRPYYVMRFIRGQDLEERIHELHAAGTPRAELRRLIRHLISACKTLEYAHSRRILHCDIKPMNIMVGKYGETLVLDWGEAISLDSGTMASEGPLPVAAGGGRSSSEAAGGTLLYMPPERLQKDPPPLTPASDVYSLGVTLYKLLTGREPYRSLGRMQLIDDIRAGIHVPANEVRRNVPGALSAICRKAMALHPEDRYRGAGELARDLEAWMDDEPVSAYEETRWEKLARWTRRHRTLAQTGLVVVLSLMLLTMITTGLLFSHGKAQAEALETAETARRSNLRALADGAARQMASQAEVRWAILNVLAHDEELLRLMPRTPDQEQLFLTQDRDSFERLQNWLARKFDEFHLRLKASSLFVLSQQGNQLGRYPESNLLPFGELPRFLGHKSYFHGRPEELAGDELVNIRPLQRDSMSTVFFSGTDRRRKVAFSVPIRAGSLFDTGFRRDDEGPVIGVLVMTVNVEDFSPPQIQMDEAIERNVLLVDMRPDWKDRTGTLLLHPEFDERSIDSDQSSVPMLPPALKSRFDELLNRWTERRPPEVWEEFLDPLGNESSLAAISAVTVDVGLPGWFVVVEERVADPPKRAVTPAR